MPLIQSGSRAATSRNISEMVHAGHPQNQAVAAALSNARKYGGGHFAVGGAPMGQQFATRQVMKEGFLHSGVPGRTDKLPISVAGGSYVLPADHVAALGQGNSLAGAGIVNKMFRMGPAGASAASIHGIRSSAPHLNMRMRAAGGEAGHGKPTDIIAAGGEIVIPPDKIVARFGNLEQGHKALDKWVIATRKQHIKTLRGLKPPKKD